MASFDFENTALVVVDWDETVTAEDTLALLANAAYEFKPGLSPNWKFYYDAYMADYAEYCSKFGDIETLEDQIRFLRDMKKVENASIPRIEKNEVFKDVPVELLLNQVDKVKFRAGWWDFARQLRAQQVRLVILSVNWSAQFIREAFERNGFCNVEVYANDFESNSRGLLTGTMLGSRRTATDKLATLKEITEKYKLEIESKSGNYAYFGDSSTDLLCILHAPAGYVVGKTSVLETAGRLNLAVSKLSFISDFNELIGMES